MPRDYSANTFWTKEETDRLIEWLEDSENLRKIKKGSGITKKAIVAEIATCITTKDAVKIGYKYDNLMKSYRAAAKLNGQSGWGLSEQDLEEGRRSLRDKLLSRCPYFFRLEKLLGDRPNIHPPITYDSGLDAISTAEMIEQLRDSVSSEHSQEVEEVGLPNPGRSEIGEEEEENEIGSGEFGRGHEVEENRRLPIPRGSSAIGLRRSQELPILVEEDAEEQENDYRGNQDGREARKGEREGENEDEEMRQRVQSEEQGISRRDLPAMHQSSVQAAGGRRKRQFPEMLIAEGEDGEALQGISKKKKGASNALVEAVGILASTRAEGEEKKYEFLNRHLIQQGELRQRELELETQKLELEREKARAEQRRTDLLILQLQGSLGRQSSYDRGRGYEEFNREAFE